MRRALLMLIFLCATAVYDSPAVSAQPPNGQTTTTPNPARPRKKAVPRPPTPESKPPTLDVLSKQAQDEEVNVMVRGAFLTSRPKPDGGGESPSGKPSSTGPSKPSGTNNPKGPRTTKPPARTTPKTTPVPPPVSSDAVKSDKGIPPVAASNSLGVGYTLYLRDAKGRLVRTRPGRAFTSGEGIRLSLEPNVDGYLYIFNTTDGGALRMLYPHGLLNEGDNKVTAHATYQLPPVGYSEDFNFNTQPGVERLYIVVSRQPLEGIETGAALVELCRSRGADAECEWEATPAVLALLQKEATAQKLTSRNDESAGQPQTTAEQVSATRGLTLGKADPAPSVILLNASPTADIFVTTLDLVHK